MNRAGNKFYEESNREETMDHRQMTAPCGLNCANCTINQGTKDPRSAKPMIMVLKPLLAFAALFSEKTKIKLNALNQMLKVPAEKPLCRGCRNENGACLFLGDGQLCKIYVCAEEKGIHNCSECSNFPCELLYPSAKLADMVPHNTKLTNLAMIKKVGIDTWAEDHSQQILDNYFKGDFPLDQ